MLIFASGDGRLTVVPSQLNQNSNGANTVYLTGAFSPSSVVTIAFTLPDGTNVDPRVMTKSDKTVEYVGETLFVFEYTLPKSITEIWGKLTAQFYITNGSETLATESTAITIARGVPSSSVGDPPPSVYEQILAALSSLNSELVNKLDREYSATDYDQVYAKDKSGARKMKNSSSEVLKEKGSVVERDENGNVSTAEATEDQHAINRKQFIEELAAALASKLDITGGKISGSLDVSGDLSVAGDFTAKGKTFIEEATTLAVKNAIIETNAGKIDLKTILSGLAINKNENATYGLMYDPTDDTVKFGLGSVDENGKFTFNLNEGAALAVRADSRLLYDGHVISWNAERNEFVDSGVNSADIAVKSELAHLEAKINENIIRDPSKTYLVYKGTTVPSVSMDVGEWTFRAGVVIDWGDGSSQTAVANVKNEHTYTDGVEYHLIAISGLTAIPSMCFYDDTSIIEAYISTGAPYMTIDVSAFENAVGLKKIRFSNKVTELAGMAFLHCTSLETMIFEGTTAPTLGLPEPIPINVIKKIFVPKSAVNAYKTAPTWSNYVDKIVYEIDSSDLDGYVEAKNALDGQAILYLATNGNPNDAVYMSLVKTGYTVPRRYANGQIEVGDPEGDSDAVPKKYAENNFVKAINVTENTYVYAASSEGPNGRLRVTTTVDRETMVQRTGDATVRTNDPIYAYDAVNKQYADANYIPLKQITSGAFIVPQIGYNKEIYWLGSDVNLTGSSLAQRTPEGRLRATDPVDQYDLVNLQYFNANVAKVAIGKDDVSNIAIPYVRTDNSIDKNSKCFRLTEIEAYGKLNGKDAYIRFSAVTNSVKEPTLASELYAILTEKALYEDHKTYIGLYAYDSGTDLAWKSAIINVTRSAINVLLTGDESETLSMPSPDSISYYPHMTLYY